MKYHELSEEQKRIARILAIELRSAGGKYTDISKAVQARLGCEPIHKETIRRMVEGVKRPPPPEKKVVEAAVATVSNMVDDLLDKMEAVKNMSPAQRMLYFADRQLTRQAMIATVIDEMVMVEMVALQRKEEVDTKLLYLLSSLSKNYNIRPSEMLRIAEYAEQIGDTSDDPITFTATKEANTGQPKATT